MSAVGSDLQQRLKRLWTNPAGDNTIRRLRSRSNVDEEQLNIPFTKPFNEQRLTNPVRKPFVEQQVTNRKNSNGQPVGNIANDEPQTSTVNLPPDHQLQQVTNEKQLPSPVEVIIHNLQQTNNVEMYSKDQQLNAPVRRYKKRQQVPTPFRKPSNEQNVNSVAKKIHDEQQPVSPVKMNVEKKTTSGAVNGMVFNFMTNNASNPDTLISNLKTTKSVSEVGPWSNKSREKDYETSKGSLVKQLAQNLQMNVQTPESLSGEKDAPKVRRNSPKVRENSVNEDSKQVVYSSRNSKIENVVENTEKISINDFQRARIHMDEFLKRLIERCGGVIDVNQIRRS